MAHRRKRVLLAKMGTDGHDLGLKFVASVLREAGMEVVYLGPYQTPEKVFHTAVQEWVDVIGIGSLSGEYMTFVPQLHGLLKEKKLDDAIGIVLGGLVAKEDIPRLWECGVRRIFHPGATSREIVDGIHACGPRPAGRRKGAGGADAQRPGRRT
jgi:methylmalonyl-CoA mutase C-terminal domain/subunit